MFTHIYEGWWCSPTSIFFGKRHFTGKNRYWKCLQKCPSTSSWQASPGDAMERPALYWYCPSVRAPLISKNIQLHCRCPPVDSYAEGVSHTLITIWMTSSPLVLPTAQSVVIISPSSLIPATFSVFPTAMDKQEGPTTCIIFLGVELDTEKLELRLPHRKLLRLKSLLQQWIHLKSVKKKDLDSLVGQLHDASIVIRSGRTFIHRLIDALKSAHNRPSNSGSNSFVRLNIEACSNILWWASGAFIEHWNGLSMMHNLHRNNPDITITSDASGSWGCGAYTALLHGFNTTGLLIYNTNTLLSKSFSLL